MSAGGRRSKWDVAASSVENPTHNTATAAAAGTPAALAAASSAAERINAMFKPSSAAPPVTKLAEVQMEEVEINDSKQRFVLTKAATMKDISNRTGAVLTTKGRYVPPGTDAHGEKPLYIEITGKTHGRN
eukprot:GFYU01048836.1.p2 GENE.GFYU01048836.1~~GFYU01048836.1.p2  ORF type:complete len:130 (+),score=19.93 GFYU01048836.1:116-505(+)